MSATVRVVGEIVENRPKEDTHATIILNLKEDIIKVVLLEKEGRHDTITKDVDEVGLYGKVQKVEQDITALVPPIGIRATIKMPRKDDVSRPCREDRPFFRIDVSGVILVAKQVFTVLVSEDDIDIGSLSKVVFVQTNSMGKAEKSFIVSDNGLYSVLFRDSNVLENLRVLSYGVRYDTIIHKNTRKKRQKISIVGEKRFYPVVRFWP